LETNATVGSYWIRAVPQSCVSNANDGKGSLSNGILSYNTPTVTPGGEPAALPVSTMAATTDGCFDEALDKAVPIPSKSVDRSAFNLMHIPLASPFKVTSTVEGRVFRWQLGGVTAVVDWQNPVLSRIATGNTTFTPSDNIVEVDGTSQWAFWFIQNNFFEPHP